MTTHVQTVFNPPAARIFFKSDPAGKPPALDYGVLDELEAAIGRTEERIPEIRLLFIESLEPKYFVVGANLKALQETDHESIRPWVRRGHQVFNRLQEIAIPVVAVVRGIAAGGGLELALSCDFIYAADSARFSLPEAGLGLIQGWGGTFRMPLRTGAAIAKELLFSGRTVDARKAYEYGIVNFCGSEEELAERIELFTGEVTRNSSVSLAMIKSCINSASGPDKTRMQFEEAAASTAAMASGDTMERLRNFFAERSRRRGENKA